MLAAEASADGSKTTGIEAFLEEDRHKGLLRFVVVGSVDDGKSTLIGRLLHDSDNVALDQVEAVKKASNAEVGEIDFSLFTDGLQAEREQGITIDVAYRYFATRKRKFIIADTPGHTQYTRNMVTGASTASAAIILLDARLGVLTQSRRHAYIASLLGIPRLIVAVNKMDLVDYRKERFDELVSSFTEVCDKLGFQEVRFFPVSALKGDNIVERSEKTPWFDGETILEYLEATPVDDDRNLDAVRFPVQLVIRPNLDYRAFAGRLSAGRIKTGDEMLVLPSLKRSRVKAIDFGSEKLAEASAGESVSIRLEDEVDISRGDMLVGPDDVPRVTRSFEADLVWMDERPLDLDKTYLLKHTTQWCRVQLREVLSKLDLERLEWEGAGGLELNDIARVAISSRRALFVDDYSVNRGTGAFVLIDSLTNHTVAAGMVRLKRGAGQDLDDALHELRAGSALTPKTQVSPRERQERLGQQGVVVWLSGLPGSGRWALAYALERRLFDRGQTAHVVEPVEGIDAMVAAAQACAHAGLVTICAFPFKTEADRAKARAAVGNGAFFEVYVNTDVALCKERRPSADFDGFEPPAQPAMSLALENLRIDQGVDAILQALQERDVFYDARG